MDFELTKLPEMPTNLPRDEGLLHKAGRTIARTGARAVETILGIPGNIAEAPFQIAKSLEPLRKEPLFSKEQIAAAHIPGRERTPENIKKKLEELEKANFFKEPERGPIPLPTSEEIRKHISDPLLGELQQPKNEWETRGDELISDFVSLLSPGGLSKAPLKAATKAAALAGAGNLASYSAEKMKFGKGAQDAAKLGVTFAGALFPSKLVPHMDALYKTAEKAIPETAIVSGKKAADNLIKLDKIVNKQGITTTTKETLRKTIKELKDKLKTGNLPLSEAVQIKKDLGDIIYTGKESRGLEKLLRPVYHDFNSIIESGGKDYPEFLSAYRAADDIYKGLHQASTIKSFLNKHVTVKNAMNPILHGLLFAGNINPLHSLYGLGGALAAKNVYNGLEAFTRSPQIRKYFAGLAKASAQENARLASSYLYKLDKEFSKNNISRQEEGDFVLSKMPQSSEL